MSHFAFSFLVCRVRQQRDIARTLYCFCQHPLMCCAISGDASRQNLSAFGKIIEQQSNVLEVDQIYLVYTEPADSPAMNATSSTAAHRASILIVVGIVTTTTAARAVFIIG